VSSLSPRLYVVEFRPVFATPRISGHLRAISASTEEGCRHLLRSAHHLALSFIQGTSEIALRAEERAGRAFATFADIPYCDRHKQRELECLVNDTQGDHCA
jgi:hypothetical protein